jgi:hypothetical protein
VYKEIYDFSEMCKEDQLMERWINQGIEEKEICFNFDVPDAFDAEQYIENHKIRNNKMYAYICWFRGTKDKIYMRRAKKKNLSMCPQNVLMEDYFNICSMLNKIIKYDTRDQGLLELSKYCAKTPYVAINEITQSYEHAFFS